MVPRAERLAYSGLVARADFGCDADHPRPSSLFSRRASAIRRGISSSAIPISRARSSLRSTKLVHFDALGYLRTASGAILSALRCSDRAAFSSSASSGPASEMLLASMPVPAFYARMSRSRRSRADPIVGGATELAIGLRIEVERRCRHAGGIPACSTKKGDPRLIAGRPSRPGHGGGLRSAPGPVKLDTSGGRAKGH